MLVSGIYGLVAATTSVALILTLLLFIPFLSSQRIAENDIDASTFTLFTIDVCLVVLFMAQHSGLASTFYRHLMEDLGLRPVTRSVYVLFTALMLQLLMYVWQPIGEVRFWLIDTKDHPVLASFFLVLHAVLWVVLFLQVLVLEPLHLIGVKQVYHYIQSREPAQSYRNTRLRHLLIQMPHTGAGCFIAILWIHPCMTFDRMILATVFTAYLCCTFSLGERDYEFVKKCSWATKTVHSATHRSKKVR